MLRWAAIVVVVLLSPLTACGGGSDDSSAPPAESPAELRDVFQANGLDCRHFLPKPDREVGTDAQGTCEVDGEDTELSTFRDHKQLDNWLGLGEKFGCAVAKQFGITSYTVVIGPDWTATPNTAATGRKIAEAVDAEMKTVRC